jgi:hypothetical protein
MPVIPFSPVPQLIPYFLNGPESCGLLKFPTTVEISKTIMMVETSLLASYTLTLMLNCLAMIPKIVD